MAFDQIFTIVRSSNLSTLVLGLLEGPMNAATGKLYLCDGELCSPLYVSSRFVFLLNYAAYTTNNNFVVMSIDYYFLQVYLNPQVQPNSTIIPSNYSINYTQYINEPYCSAIRIINSSFTNSFSILSCSYNYYYARIDFAQQSLTVVNRFARYSQCDMQD